MPSDRFFENILFETKELQGKMDGWRTGFLFKWLFFRFHLQLFRRSSKSVAFPFWIAVLSEW